MQANVFDDRRAEALYILRHGWMTVSEVAAIVATTRQTVHYWAKTAGFDYRKRRAVFQRRCRQRARKALKQKGRVNGV